jgi:DNA repair photolyase
MEKFNGKAIYNPSGKAGEYSYWACNFFVGCSNGCTYCYLKKGRGASILGGDKPKLKKCFRNEAHALEVFEKELLQNIEELRKHGLFFTFTSDPMLKETMDLTFSAMTICYMSKIPVKILTKRADFVDAFLKQISGFKFPTELIAFGFTLTGHDILEPGANTNAERIVAMQKLHEAGFKTFASIEPIIDFISAKNMISATLDFCDLYKIGLLSGGKYDKVEVQTFVEWLNDIWEQPKIYLKESIQKLSHYTNDQLGDNFVNRDYNMFENK